MMPTLEIGDRLVADMKLYEKESPARGDLIIFMKPMDGPVPCIKRVIGLPGEKIEMIGRTVYINDHPLKETYTQYIDPESTYDRSGPFHVPEGHYFAMGDNRDNSQDSRYWGSIKRSNILGRARYLYWAKNISCIGKKLN
jgi:signal peptidase I